MTDQGLSPEDEAFEGVVRARIEAQTRLDQMTQNHNEALRLYSKWRSRAEKAEAEIARLAAPLDEREREG